MKVLQINSVCGVGSTGRICTDLAEALMLRGHECRIAYGRENAPREFEDISVRIGGSASVYAHALAARTLDLSGFGSRCASEKFLKWAKAYDPDIVHLHNLHGYYINLPMLFEFLKSTKKPTLMTLHDAWSFTGHCAHFELCGCQKWRDVCRKCPQTGEYPTSFYDGSQRNFIKKRELFTSLENVTVISPSNWLAELARSSYLSKYRIKVIHNGIDTERFCPTKSDIRASFGLEGKRIALGVASVWNEKKGFFDMLSLAELLPKEWHTVLIGQPPTKVLSPRITQIARTDSIEQLAQWYSAADVFVNPTYEDTFPTVNLEAQACGTPVITYKTGGSPESIICGKTGYVTNEKTPNAVCEIIRCGVEKNAYACRENAKKYDKRRRFEEYIGEYRELLLSREE